MNNPPVKKHFSIVDEDGTQTDFISIDHSRSPDCCELCGATDELRPYGPYGKWVCFDCGMLDEENAKRIFHKTLVDPVDAEGEMVGACLAGDVKQMVPNKE